MKTTHLLREIGKLIEQYEKLNNTELVCTMRVSVYPFNVTWDGEKFVKEFQFARP